jgi:glycine/D-amino acid oxidase-like deaminating enzyme
VKVAIIGGGCMGASIAAHLAARGAEVDLLERDTLASGPTGRSTAVIRQYYAHPLLIKMAMYGLQTYSSFERTFGGSAGFVQTGVIWLADANARDAMKRNVTAARAEGAAIELVDHARLREIEPRLASDGIMMSCIEPTAGYADPYLATARFAGTASRLGARIQERAPVEAIADLDADVLVVAAGPWSARLLEPLGYEIPLKAIRAQIGRWRVPIDFVSPLPIIADFSRLDFYAKPGEAGFIEVGAVEPSVEEWIKDPSAVPECAEPEMLEKLRCSLVHRIPALAGGHWRGSWSGVYDMTPDMHPVVGLAPGTTNVFVAAGFSGHGFKLAPAVGLGLAELIVTGGFQTLDLTPLRPDRFARGARIAESQWRR